MTLASLDRSTIVDRLTDSLIDAVIAGTFPVGAPLPPERDLAEQLGVNRATVRQAVARLEQIGLVVRRQGSGTVVRDPATVTAPEVVARLGGDDGLALLADLLEVREALAVVIGRRAAPRITAGDIDRLRARCREVAAAPDAASRQLIELDFFGVLVEVGGNRAIGALLQWVSEVYGRIGDDGPTASFAPAFADGASVAARLEAIVEVAAHGGDLAAAVGDYAARTGELLVEAARRSPG